MKTGPFLKRVGLITTAVGMFTASEAASSAAMITPSSPSANFPSGTPTIGTNGIGSFSLASGGEVLMTSILPPDSSLVSGSSIKFELTFKDFTWDRSTRSNLILAIGNGTQYIGLGLIPNDDHHVPSYTDPTILSIWGGTLGINETGISDPAFATATALMGSDIPINPGSSTTFHLDATFHQNPGEEAWIDVQGYRDGDTLYNASKLEVRDPAMLFEINPSNAVIAIISPLESPRPGRPSFVNVGEIDYRVSNVAPEPTSGILLGLGAVLLATRRRRELGGEPGNSVEKGQNAQNLHNSIISK